MQNNTDKNITNKEDVNLTSSFACKTKTIQRKCAGCNKIMERTLLIKILKCHKTKQLILQPDNKQFGRSIYFCPNISCFNHILKKKRIQRNLKTELTEEFIQKIKDIILK